MQLVEFSPQLPDEPAHPRFGVIVNDQIVEIGESERGTLSDYIWRGAPAFEDIRAMYAACLQGATPVLRGHARRTFPLEHCKLHPPLLPRTLRDFYAFERHVKAANAIRGREVPPEWYEIPVFYYAHHGTLCGNDDTVPYPAYTVALDYELEIAAVIGKAGRDIPANQAEDYILGFTILNDWSARDVQRLEMRVGLGPAKGKDFAKSLGPCLVTLDELADRRTERHGVFDLQMVARVNGVERSRGNMAELYWSFGQMIARASQAVTLQPGDVIGSGTVGTGCLLELTHGEGPWLQHGDIVELAIERIGTLRNRVG
ncbi:MAG: fumarylacetoacetate hydrolase [Candidatus Thermofonsia Clade 1 bacterium]|uniref:Fumarylacetoacetate hydrolase n=1 Tax=Candidatus Thermofonsia Clade 1 bacterium TaxID=2364210 RepID=A0A2M8Q0Y3_9CHLR|nr:MAG: fumarylacetoacetate hydrolase [Candidatus Thermofonsia Clade 1 bacterium]